MSVPKQTFSQMVGKIPKPKLDASGTVRFSFKYAQVPGSRPFCIEECERGYFIKLLERLSAISTMPTSEFAGPYQKALRNHPVNFADGSVSQDGFYCLNPEIRKEADPAAYQFSISKSEHGRIMGFLVGDVFFVVWFDPLHKMYD